ncbi:50S ribosomal protein L35 [Pyrus ussuriensis x Pyrus communis]|uniref:50S ribosomal protein L35 n=1 Tax=Pyrus ussuriensis x Pyrus communis TaxID=2448454 RepID=A0A5N5FEJ1_9ROSA|nr:50S ribosomal protein L35 [Pyrus ussuriensis x Pyrus communis]
MACVGVAMTMVSSFGLRYSLSCSYPSQLPHGSVQLGQLKRPNSLRPSSLQSHSICGLNSLLPNKLCAISSTPPGHLRSFTIVSAKGYKMKTHKGVLPGYAHPPGTSHLYVKQLIQR